MSSRPHTHSAGVECSWCSLPFATRFVIESAAIERQRITPERAVTSAHMEAYKAMILLADSGDELLLSDLKNWQAMIGREQHLWGDRALSKDELGQFREWNIALGREDGSQKSIGTQWTTIDDEMADLWDLLWPRGGGAYGWTGNPLGWLNRDPIEKAAIIHHTFERIHPFPDGNGRSGRLLALYLLRALKQPPVLFTNWDKGERYYPCFETSDPQPMINYFRTHQVQFW